MYTRGSTCLVWRGLKLHRRVSTQGKSFGMQCPLYTPFNTMKIQKKNPMAITGVHTITTGCRPSQGDSYEILEIIWRSSVMSRSHVDPLSRMQWWGSSPRRPTIRWATLSAEDHGSGPVWSEVGHPLSSAGEKWRPRRTRRKWYRASNKAHFQDQPSFRTNAPEMHKMHRHHFFQLFRQNDESL